MIIIAVLAAVAMIAPDPGEPPLDPTPIAQPVAAATTAPALLGDCGSVQVVTITEPTLVNSTQVGIGLLTDALGCVPFRVGSGGTPVAFHDFADSWYSLRLLSSVTGYSDGHWEIWVNPVCWPLVGGWPETIAHELGHLLGWRDMDGHPYMAAPAPLGARVGPNAIIEC